MRGQISPSLSSIFHRRGAGVRSDENADDEAVVLRAAVRCMTTTHLSQVAGLDAPSGGGFWAPTDRSLHVPAACTPTAVSLQ